MRTAHRGTWLPIVLLLAAGAVGAASSLGVVRWLHPGGAVSFPDATGVTSVVTTALAAGVGVGVTLAVMFVVFVMWGRADTGIRCPRCGTANEPRAARCKACALAMMPRA